MVEGVSQGLCSGREEVKNACPVSLSTMNSTDEKLPYGKYVQTPWGTDWETLQDKSVQFRILSEKHGRIKGTGQFFVRTYGDGSLRSLEIDVNQTNGETLVVDKFNCPERSVALIKALPQGSQCEFCLFEF